MEHFYAAFSGVKAGSSTALLMVRVKAQAALAACMVRLGQGKQSMEMSTKVRVGGVAVPTCDANCYSLPLAPPPQALSGSMTALGMQGVDRPDHHARTLRIASVTQLAHRNDASGHARANMQQVLGMIVACGVSARAELCALCALCAGQALMYAQQGLGSDSVLAGCIMADMAWLCLALRCAPEAEAYIGAAKARILPRLAPAHSEVLACLHTAAWVYFEQGDTERARETVATIVKR